MDRGKREDRLLFIVGSTFITNTSEGGGHAQPISLFIKKCSVPAIQYLRNQDHQKE